MSDHHYIDQDQLPRRCSRCGHPAVRCLGVMRYELSGVVPTGTERQHRCDACGRTFRTESLWRTIVCTVYVSPLLLVAGATAWVVFVKYGMNPLRPASMKSTDWIVVAVGAGALLFGLLFYVPSLRRAVHNVRNPVIGRGR